MKVLNELETKTYIKTLLEDFLFQESNFQTNDNKFQAGNRDREKTITAIFTHYKVEKKKNILFTELLVFFPSSSDFFFSHLGEFKQKPKTRNAY